MFQDIALTILATIGAVSLAIVIVGFIDSIAWNYAEKRIDRRTQAAIQALEEQAGMQAQRTTQADTQPLEGADIAVGSIDVSHITDNRLEWNKELGHLEEDHLK